MIGGVIGMGRRIMKARMVDECRITREGEKVWDEEQGQWNAEEVAVYAGICEVKAPTLAGKPAEAGSHLIVVSQTELRLPHEAVGVRPGDEALITACKLRPELVGRKFKVGAPFDGSLTTALRYRVEVADGR